MTRFAYLERKSGAATGVRAELLADKRRAQRDYIAALKRSTPQAQLGEQWASTAQEHIETALTDAWHKTRAAQPFVKNHKGPVSGLFVLGLGKLGGRDLNYSSDVDLVAFYDARTLPVPEAAGRTYVCAQVLRTFNQTIDAQSSGFFAWRVDWRLRPDPSVTDLAMSAEAGLDYFFFRSAPWRRLAMAKARVVAGDMAAGQAFLDELSPFIWRRSLDFSMVEDMAHIKRRIHLEHPELADARRVSHDLAVQDGFNLKLGRGGIRDVEFIVNAKQLLWGGRQSELQTTHTMSALTALTELGHLRADESAKLRRAYIAMRTLENGLQAYGDAHTHILPKDEDQRAWLCDISGTETWSDLCEAISLHRQHVASHFDELFAEVSPSRPLQRLKHLSANVLGLDAKEAQSLASVLATIDAHLDRQNDPAAALNLFKTWMQKLQAPQAYLRAMQSAPNLADMAVRSFLESPTLQSLVQQSPQVLDALFANHDLLNTFDIRPLIENGARAARADMSYERRLAGLRAWINESLYLTYLVNFSGSLNWRETMDALTKLAEAALDYCAQVVADEHGLERLPFTILALGRLGMAAMAPNSDLDLIFVLDEDQDLETGNKIVGQFLRAMNARMKEGRVYEIDTRLRPSGASGPPTLRLHSYINHQLERAKTWEHLALHYMRPVFGTYYGDAATVKAVQDMQAQVRGRARDLEQWRKDCQLMLRRLLAQRIGQANQSPGEVKLAKGGLMECEYILATRALTSPAPWLEATQIHETLTQAMLAHRIHGDAWPHTFNKLHEAFLKASTQVREQTISMLGEPKAFATLDDHEETAVIWTKP